MIARKSALIISTEMMNGALGYIALFFITRNIGPDEYGIVAFALGFVTLFSVFGNLGMNETHVKKVSEKKKFAICNGTFLFIKLCLIVFMTSVTLGSIFIWKDFFGRGFESPTHEIAIYIMLGYWIIRFLSRFFISTFKGKREIAKARTPLFLGTLVRVLLTIYIALAGYGALVLALTYVAGEISTLIASAFLFRHYPIKKPTREYIIDYSKFAFPLIVVVTCATIMTNLDKVIIQLFWSSTDVGYYYAAYRLTNFINMFTIAIGTLLLPVYSELESLNNINKIRKLTVLSERYVSMIVFPLVFGIIILAEPATYILLSGWMPAIPIIQILPFFTLFAALERPYQSQFIGMNRPKLARNRIIIMVTINVILNMILIPKDIQMFGIKLFGLGAKGAAIATVISYLIGLIYSRYISYKLLKIKGSYRIMLHGISAIFMATILYIILNVIFTIQIITRWYHLIAFSVLGLLIYLSFLYLLGEFNKEDFHFFIDTVHPIKMLRYITKEIFEKK